MSRLAIDAVSRTFPGGRRHAPTVALEPTTLTVADNDFISILGPSGCGKSTLLRIIAGLDVPTSGRVFLDGAPVSAPGADRGMVFQSYTLFPWLTVRQNICFGLREKGVAQVRQDEIAARYVERVGLRGFEVASIELIGSGDAVIDFEVTANRPDCLSVLGLAREVATIYDLPLTLPSSVIGAMV